MNPRVLKLQVWNSVLWQSSAGFSDSNVKQKSLWGFTKLKLRTLLSQLTGCVTRHLLSARHFVMADSKTSKLPMTNFILERIILIGFFLRSFHICKGNFSSELVQRRQAHGEVSHGDGHHKESATDVNRGRFNSLPEVSNRKLGRRGRLTPFESCSTF